MLRSNNVSKRHSEKHMLGKTVLKCKYHSLIYIYFTSVGAHTSEQLVHYTFGTSFSITTHNSDAVRRCPINTMLPSWLGHLPQNQNSQDQHVLPSTHLCAELSNILCCLLTPEFHSYFCSTCLLVTMPATSRFTFVGIPAQDPDLYLQLWISEKKAGKYSESHSACNSGLHFCWNLEWYVSKARKFGKMHTWVCPSDRAGIQTMATGSRKAILDP